ncbi:MAG: radical SAM protein [Chitinispirillaceae bacterium]|nr:radical SAM protein [Chitinispirillaceae bacterium]
MERKEVLKPILLHYYITNRCNSRCGFCNIWLESPKIDAKTPDVLKNLQFYKKKGCKFVDFTGGEPLLHKDLPLFLSEAKRLGYITSVTTNCLLFPERAEELAGKIDLLHFSLDSDDPELHNEIRGCNSYDKVIESIPIALKKNLLPDLLFTYTEKNINSFEGVYELARRYRLMVILDPVFSVIGGPDVLPKKVHVKALELSRKRGVYLNNAHLTLRFQGGNHIRDPLCRAVTSTVVILPDNRRAFPCFHHRCSFIPAGEEELYEKEVLSALSMEGRYSFCEGCHINCYFDPSYTYLRNPLFFQSIRSKFLYIISKYFIYRHLFSFFRLYFRI